MWLTVLLCTVLKLYPMFISVNFDISRNVLASFITLDRRSKQRESGSKVRNDRRLLLYDSSDSWINFPEVFPPPVITYMTQKFLSGFTLIRSLAFFTTTTGPRFISFWWIGLTNAWVNRNEYGDFCAFKKKDVSGFDVLVIYYFFLFFLFFFSVLRKRRRPADSPSWWAKCIHDNNIHLFSLSFYVSSFT